jgi:dTDP-4-amino-4,6-dideoxygalactose transaminase
MNVPFLDLKAINARHAAELKAAAARVIDSGWYVLGEEVKAFEAEFAAWTVRYSSSPTRTPSTSAPRS